MTGDGDEGTEDGDEAVTTTEPVAAPDRTHAHSDPHAGDPVVHGDGRPLGDLDDGERELPLDAVVAESLRTAMHAVREEAHRIAEMPTGDDKVAAAERFAEAAGQLDEQLGAAARDDEHHDA